MDSRNYERFIINLPTNIANNVNLCTWYAIVIDMN